MSPLAGFGIKPHYPRCYLGWKLWSSVMSAHIFQMKCPFLIISALKTPHDMTTACGPLHIMADGLYFVPCVRTEYFYDGGMDLDQALT